MTYLRPVRRAAALLVGLILATATSSARPLPAAAICFGQCESLVVQLPTTGPFGSPDGSGTVISSDNAIHCDVQFEKVLSGSYCSHLYTSSEVTFPYAITITIAGDHSTACGAQGSWTCDAGTDLQLHYLLSPPIGGSGTTTLPIAFYLFDYKLTVTLGGPGQGRVTSVPSGIDCPGTCASMFKYGASVGLTATPNEHSTFTGWSGGCASLDTLCTRQIVDDETQAASFGVAVPTMTPLATATPRPTPTMSSASTARPRSTSAAPTPPPGPTTRESTFAEQTPGPGSTPGVPTQQTTGPLETVSLAAVGATPAGSPSTFGDAEAAQPPGAGDPIPMLAVAILLGLALVAVLIVSMAAVRARRGPRAET